MKTPSQLRLAVSLLMGLMISNISFASTFTCFQPTGAGNFTIDLQSFGVPPGCGPITVPITLPCTPASKALRIAAAINASPCGPMYTAVAAGANVTVTNTAFPNSTVFFKFGPDATGEKNRIEKALNDAIPWYDFWSSPPLFTCASPASGHSFDGTSAGTVFIGSSTYVATVFTTPGESALAIMTDAQNQLTANGVSATLVSLPGSTYGIQLNDLASSTYVEFGTDDSGAACMFQMFEPTAETFCFGDGTVRPCPCANNGAPGNGCANSDHTNGANLAASGSASLSCDTLVLSVTDQKAGSLSILLQGNVEIQPTTFGDGLRCIGGNLKRLFLVLNAHSSAITIPSLASSPPYPATVSSQSAAKGDPLIAGLIRDYQLYYRDGNASFCQNPPGNTFNITNGLRVQWGQ